MLTPEGRNAFRCVMLAGIKLLIKKETPVQLSQSHLAQVAKVVERVCQVCARQFKAAPDSLTGPVFEKVVDNLCNLGGFSKSLEDYVWVTASRELRRYCLRERRPPRLASPKREQPDVVKELAKREDLAAVRPAITRLREDLREALFVYAGAQGCDGAPENLPSSVTELALRKGRSR